MLAAIRPDDWDLPLLVHVAGAMLLVGAVVVSAAAMGAALRRGDGTAVLTRLALRSLLLGVIPSYVVMRGGAEWIASKESVPDDASWVGLGYSISDGGLLLALIATVLAWRATRRPDGDPGWPLRAAAILATLLLVGYVVAIWAMTTKPS
jgi:hypothetical protein